MASMSYCRFENTSIDMQNCVYDLEEAYTLKDLQHNEYEQVARERLYQLAQEYIIQFERLKNSQQFEVDEEEEEEVDLSDHCYS